MKISRVILLLVLVLTSLNCACAQDAAPEATRVAFESWAQRAESFATDDFVYGRLGRSPSAVSGRTLRLVPQFAGTTIPPEQLRERTLRSEQARAQQQTVRQLRQFLALPHPLDDLRELARHPNPRVRTLALAAIFERMDARLLPTIAESMRDTAPTFNDKPELQISQTDLLYSGIDPRPQPQTVGQVATKMMGFYLSRSGCDGNDWPTYWKTHRDRAWSASEFEVKLDRASQGTSPLGAETAPALRQVRAEVEALPRAERNWLMLALWEPKSLSEGAEMWASEAEVVAAARELGAPQLLRMLEGQTISDDPAVRACPRGNLFRRRMEQFVLSHATQLLQPAMADAILRAEGAGANEPLWAQAAAELQPQRAAPILKAALKRFGLPYQSWQRGHLMAALWRLSGERETEFLLDWFWSETPDRNASPAGAPGMFLDRLESAPAAPTKRLVARLLDDKRLAGLPKMSLVPLAKLVNEWAGRTVFDPRPLYGFEREGDADALTLKRDFIAQARAARTLWEK